LICVNHVFGVSLSVLLYFIWIAQRKLVL
jgi:hypothetical protein